MSRPIEVVFYWFRNSNIYWIHLRINVAVLFHRNHLNNFLVSIVKRVTRIIAFCKVLLRLWNVWNSITGTFWRFQFLDHLMQLTKLYRYYTSAICIVTFLILIQWTSLMQNLSHVQSISYWWIFNIISTNIKGFGVEWYGLKKITKRNQVIIAKWLSPVYCQLIISHWICTNWIEFVQILIKY